MTTVTDLAQRASAANVIADVGKLFGEAIARKLDKDLIVKICIKYCVEYTFCIRSYTINFFSKFFPLVIIYAYVPLVG
jgi:hypothetical protein